MLVSCHCLRVITVVTHIQPAWYFTLWCGPAKPGLHREHHGIATFGVRGSHIDSDNGREMLFDGILEIKGDKVELKGKKMGGRGLD